MYDRKVVRRRRAALAVFLCLSLALLTVYFGETGGGLFHSVQRGAQEAFAPLESGASKVLKPVRDMVGWVGDTFTAKGENRRLKKELEELHYQLAQSRTAQRDLQQLGGILRLERGQAFPQGTGPVTARVIARSPSAWYSSLKIDKGSADGLKLDQPVIAAGGLCGKISKVSGGNAEVTLITDPSIGVGAQVVPAGASGVVRPTVGNAGQLLLDLVHGGRVTEKATVVTSGFRTGEGESLYPRGIPVGQVTKVDLDEVEIYQRVHVRPFADLKQIDIVQVLTKRGVSNSYPIDDQVTP